MAQVVFTASLGKRKSLEMKYFQGFVIVANVLPDTDGNENVLLVQGMIEH